MQDIYRHDEEQAYLTLMSQEVKSLNFAVEANYTVRLCKEIVNYHYPDKMPLGSFELIASNKVRSDEETLAEVFNGDSYACDKEPADDPCFDWVPRKEQIFDEKKLMQVCAGDDPVTPVVDAHEPPHPAPVCTDVDLEEGMG